MIVKIDHEKLEKAQTLYTEILDQLQDDHLIAKGNYMLREDVVVAALVVLLGDMFEVK